MGVAANRQSPVRAITFIKRGKLMMQQLFTGLIIFIGFSAWLNATEHKKHFEHEMVMIPAGDFTMGCVDGRDDVDADCSDDERPAHKVSLDAFKMGKYEVTFDQWDACEKAKICPHSDDEGWGRGKHPVINVSWNDVQQYIQWLNQKTGNNYRLPTEAEWEYTARAGGNSTYPWGNKISCKNADYNLGKCNALGSSIVGSYTANTFGLYDTVGNVWEWTQDWNGTFSSQPVVNPKGANAGTHRMLRGGSWSSRHTSAFSSTYSFMRSAVRDRLMPDASSDDIGFRLARD